MAINYMYNLPPHLLLRLHTHLRAQLQLKLTLAKIVMVIVSHNNIASEDIEQSDDRMC